MGISRALAVLCLAAAAVAGCAAERPDATVRGEPGATATPAPATALPYVVAQHQLEPSLLGLQHSESGLWATTEGGFTRVDLPSGTSTPLPDFGQVAEAFGFAIGGGYAWIPDFERSSLTRVRMSDLKVDQVPVLKNSDNASYGFGSVWVSNHRSSSVQRLEPATGAVQATVTVGTGQARCCGPSASVAAFGRVWVAVPFARGVVTIDPATNQAARTVLVEDGECSVCGDVVATGEETPAAEDDGIWAVGDTSLHRIDPRTAEVVASVDLGFPDDGASEAELAATPAGAFVGASGGRLLRVDLATAQVVAEVVLDPTARNVELELAYGDGRLWVYERFTGVLTALDPARVRSTDG